MLRIGLDIGSTTLKCVVLDDNNHLVYKNYQRHFSQITDKVIIMLSEISEMLCDSQIQLCVSGSAGISFAEQIGVPFFQEVFATKTSVKALLPEADVVIELGGEDAKILFLSGTLEVRMNGSCAGGTGAFIDQMATLLNLSPTEMNELAKQHKKIYSIASRCGVFAKSDIQPLLNQGAAKEDICASILVAVVNQTIAGLAQGREIIGNIVYLGGPMTFLSELRSYFDHNLGTNGICPQNSLYFVALGAAMLNEGGYLNLDDLIGAVKSHLSVGNYNSCEPLFENKGAYIEFLNKHDDKKRSVLHNLCDDKRAYIGIDAGSTTVKAAVINENDDVVFYKYLPNSGNPVPLIKDFLLEVYEKFPDINIIASASTGYGEEIIKNAFHTDIGIVETIAHFTAAKKYDPLVDFIIDIGGQDIKCFKIRNGVIDNIFLNEACSSGCGSFLQTFAGALGYSIADFAKLGLFADKPVDLGSRCTVFMNSSVKQAQKDGASIENISAGLSISVVKNALYKVIRVSGDQPLGEHIVVQGGTFLNDAVLRAFEQEIGKNVVRPPLSGIMGALGAALYAKQSSTEKGHLMNKSELLEFTHDVKAITCNGCTNQCKLTINIFNNGEKFIAGNQCQKPLETSEPKISYNLYEYKKLLLSEYKSFSGERETVGIPLALNMFELLPFWHTFFKNLGFGVEFSELSSKKLYSKGQNSIPSDTICYPAKLVHGHIQSLLSGGVTNIFYPCMSYNIDEGLGDNYYNCPVVAYYPEVISGNVKGIEKITFIKDYIGIHNEKIFPKKIFEVLSKYFQNISYKEVKNASKFAYKEYESYLEKIRAKGDYFLDIAVEHRLPVIVLVGRPYHIDSEINHGIDKFICECGAVLISEDAIGNHYAKFNTQVLNQWTYHSRMYAAANFVAKNKNPNINLVQLVSFGCGVDAITTDEIRRILEENDKIYTQIKIDEITNLGAVKIRLRSLFAAVNQKHN